MLLFTTLKLMQVYSCSQMVKMSHDIKLMVYPCSGSILTPLMVIIPSTSDSTGKDWMRPVALCLMFTW